MSIWNDGGALRFRLSEDIQIVVRSNRDRPDRRSSLPQPVHDSGLIVSFFDT